MPSLEPRGAPQPALAPKERRSNHKLGTTGYELVPEPNTSTQQRMEHARPLPLMRPSQRLVASGDTTLEHLGVSSPDSTELSNPGALGYGFPGLERHGILL